MCGAGILKTLPVFADTPEEAEELAEGEWQRLKPDAPLAFKARTCSTACYVALPPWRRLVLAAFPFLAGRI